MDVACDLQGAPGALGARQRPGRERAGRERAGPEGAGGAMLEGVAVLNPSPEPVERSTEHTALPLAC